MVALGERALEPFHAGHQVGLWRLQLKVVVVAHEAEGVDLPAGFDTGLAESLQPAPPVLVAAKDGLGMVTACHDVVNRARELKAQGPRHRGAGCPIEANLTNRKNVIVLARLGGLEGAKSVSS